MAHCVETMMYAGQTPWHGLGKQLVNCVDTEVAIVEAGLNWGVQMTPVQYKGKNVEDKFFTVRNTDDRVLGVVGANYQIMQNREAASLLDALIGEGCLIETAGSLHGGKVIWFLAKLPDYMEILGDAITRHILLVNSHDGSQKLRMLSTLTRVVCANTLDIALKNAENVYAVKHTAGMGDKAKSEEAMKAIGLSKKYSAALTKEADILARTPVSQADWKKIVDQLIPYDETSVSDGIKHRKEERRSLLLGCMEDDDLQNFKNTGWGAFQALTNYAYHATPERLTENYRENAFLKSVGGSVFVNTGYKMLKELVTA